MHGGFRLPARRGLLSRLARVHRPGRRGELQALRVVRSIELYLLRPSERYGPGVPVWLLRGPPLAPSRASRPRALPLEPRRIGRARLYDDTANPSSPRSWGCSRSTEAKLHGPGRGKSGGRRALSGGGFFALRGALVRLHSQRLPTRSALTPQRRDAVGHWLAPGCPQSFRLRAAADRPRRLTLLGSPRWLRYKSALWSSFVATRKAPIRPVLHLHRS